MLFEALNDSAERGELILMDGAICHYHLRRDGQLTIREILVLPEQRRQGIGRTILTKLRQIPATKSLFARCPADLESNEWYRRMGFALEGTETTKRGRTLNLWRLTLLDSNKS